MMRGLVALLLVLMAPVVLADTAVRPFVAGSLAQIQAARQGKPFVLAFWSIGCTHCPTELKTLGELKRRHPKLDIVLVAADTPDDARQTAQLAKSYGLEKVEQWVFADPMPERLRFEIDRRWYGELPRTQFYDRNHKVEAVSGVVPEERLQRWIRETL
jgi:thiol-disulfide isomerase/thioredoxin